jgi:hypothetical protein
MWTEHERTEYERRIMDAKRRLDPLFPTRFSHLMFTLQHYARTLQKFDVNFYNREPVLDVTFDKDFAHAQRCNKRQRPSADRAVARTCGVLRRHRGKRR